MPETGKIQKAILKVLFLPILLFICQFFNWLEYLRWHFCAIVEMFQMYFLLNADWIIPSK